MATITAVSTCAGIAHIKQTALYIADCKQCYGPQLFCIVMLFFKVAISNCVTDKHECFRVDCTTARLACRELKGLSICYKSLYNVSSSNCLYVPSSETM